MGGQIPGATGDPLPGPPITENSWASIRDGHQLIYLGQDMVLDWVPASGAYKVWTFDRAAVNNADPLPGSPLCEGTWSTIGADERIVYLGDERVLVWTRLTRRFRTWIIDRTARGSGADPLPGVPQTNGIWPAIDSFHEVINLGGGRILDWNKGTKTFRTFDHDPTATGATDPLKGPPPAQGSLDILPDHRLIPIGNDRVLDWSPSSGEYKVWRYERNATGALFFGEPEVVGTWSSIRAGHELVYLDGDRVLDWQPSNGHFRLWRIDRNITTLRRATVRVHVRTLHEPDNLADQVANLKSLYASYGIEVVVVSQVKPPVSETTKRLRTVEIGECKRSVPPTASQLDLFNNFREGVDPDEIVVYVISQTYPVVNGCARFPAGKPSAIVAGIWTSGYTMAHEVGHVLGLDHNEVDDTRLMYHSTAKVRDLPPDLSNTEIDTILASNLAKR